MAFRLRAPHESHALQAFWHQLLPNEHCPVSLDDTIKSQGKAKGLFVFLMIVPIFPNGIVAEMASRSNTCS